MAPIIRRRPPPCGRQVCLASRRSMPGKRLAGSSGLCGPPGAEPRASAPALKFSRSCKATREEHNMLIRRAVAGMIAGFLARFRRSLRRTFLRRDEESRISPMKRPVVGVIGNAHRVENRFQTQMVGERNLRAVADVSGALPLMFAGSPEITDVGALLDAVDGIVLTGARANVHPTRFKTEPHEKHEPYDVHRDDVALALAEACVARGVPIFGICRGLQEMNVAFGGSLHPEIREIPGRMNHRMPRLENGE